MVMLLIVRRLQEFGKYLIRKGVKSPGYVYEVLFVRLVGGLVLDFARLLFRFRPLNRGLPVITSVVGIIRARLWWSSGKPVSSK